MVFVVGVRLDGVCCWMCTVRRRNQENDMSRSQRGNLESSRTQMIDLFERLCILQILGARTQRVLSSVNVCLLLIMTKIQ
jgi:hypothetical protein